MKSIALGLTLIFLSNFISAQEISGVYYPLTPGTTWKYETTKNRVYLLPDGREQKDVVKGTSTEKVVEKDDGLVLEQSITEKSQASGQEKSTVLTSIISIKDGVVLVHGQGTDEVTRFETPAVLVDFNKVTQDKPFQTVLSVSGLNMKSESKSYEYVTLETPAGEMDKVLKIENEGTLSGTIKSGSKEIIVKGGTVNETLWLAPGKGLVQQISTTKMDMEVSPGVVIKSVEEKVKVLAKQ